MSEPLTGEVVTPHEHESGPGALISTVALIAIAGVLVYIVYRLFRTGLDERAGDIKAAYNSGVAAGKTEVEIRNNLRANERADDNSSNADTPSVAKKPRRSRRTVAGLSELADESNRDTESVD